MGANNSKPSKPEDSKARYSRPVPVKDEDYSKVLPREKLPKNLQNIVDKEDSLWDEVSEGRYGARLRPCASPGQKRSALVPRPSLTPP